jgi:hypothetical protein
LAQCEHLPVKYCSIDFGITGNTIFRLDSFEAINTLKVNYYYICNIAFSGTLPFRLADMQGNHAIMV